MDVKRFDIYLIDPDPTQGAEMQKTRPGVVISPDEMNRHIATVIIAPMTTGTRTYPTRITCAFQGKTGHIVLDQLRAIDKSRLIKRLGMLATDAQQQVLQALQELFA